VWKRAQAAQGGWAPILCGGSGLFVRASGPCARLPQHVVGISLHQHRSPANTTLGTHTRTHTRKGRWQYNTHPRRIAAHRSAAHQMLCKQFVPFSLPSHPALHYSMHGALPLPPGRTPCESSLVRCAYELSAPVRTCRHAAHTTHTLSSLQATRRGCGCSSISRRCLLD
jgi:hypothetical protein